ncbi:MAG: DUF512 domain-containing protein [Oscillospiraceae bacterium]|nr:DUF512 domain-containing protein [Oscillospiraceae bacterium]
MAVKIANILEGSPASKLNIAPGEMLVSVNGEEIEDVLDYGFYTAAEELDIVIRREDGAEETFHVSKKEYEELGIESGTFLMDREHACRNNCIFCFIDQNPRGMRDSIYFKDDDTRLSFLFGSYVTLTNLTDRDIDRLIKMKISPVNISVHTTEPELRCLMMGNRFAGDSLRHLYRLADSGAEINCQIVVCRGWNDGEHLKRTVTDLIALCPAVASIAVVPVGLTSHRNGLTKLEPFDRDSAREVIGILGPFQDECLERFGDRIVYPSDELYIIAEEKIPGADEYGDYKQIENGVGMVSRFEEEFVSALELEEGDDEERYADIVTGLMSYDMIVALTDRISDKFPQTHVRVHGVRNDFFGPTITVSGLLTATDILAQVKREDVRADRIILPEAVLRRDGDRFLDDITKEEFEQKMGLPVRTDEDGADLLDAILGR